MASKVRDIMTSNPICMPSSATAADAATKMRDADVGAIIVEKPQGGVCGIVTDRDLVVRGFADGVDGAQKPLEKICSGSLFSVGTDDDTDKVVDIMRERGVRRVPVLDGQTCQGIVSLGDMAMERDRESVLGQISAAPANR